MKESDIQSDIMCALGKHPKVAWVYVTSTGKFKGLKGGGIITIGIPGMPDIMGQMRDGRVLGVEVKKPGEKPTKEQDDFLFMIAKNKGLACWGDCVEDIIKFIER